MSDEVPEVLYDRDGGAMYFSRERVVRMIARIDEFRVYRDGFDKESATNTEVYYRNKAGRMVGRIERIKMVIPNEVRGSLPNYFRVSDRDLDELQKRYSELFFGVKAHAS